MISKKLVIGSLLATAALMSDSTTEVQADPIVTSAVACSNGTPGEANDFQRFSNAIVNINALPRLAVCAVPRSPALPAGANPTFVFSGFDGQCTATSYLSNGAVQAQINFVLAPTGTIATVTFPVAVAGPTSNISLSCLLNTGGALLTLTAAN